MGKFIDFSKNPYTRKLMGAILSTAHRVNAQIKTEFGEQFQFDLRPRQGHFEINDKDHKYNGYNVRYNAVIPNTELFSLATQLVRAKDEPFAARKVFKIDSSYHVGSQTIGYDILVEQGEAKLIAAGRAGGSEIPQADASIDRELQNVGKISNYFTITRDDIQQMDLRNARGMGPLVDLLSEKMRTARKNISRVEDSIIWTGGNIAGVAASKIQGIFDFFSTTSGDFTGAQPTKGQKKTGLAVWSGLTSDAIIAQLAVAAGYVSRNNSYFANTLVLPTDLMIQEIGLKKTSETDSTPLIKWIKMAFQEAFDRPLNVVTTSALNGPGTTSGTTRTETGLTFRAFMLLDADQDHQAIAEVEAMTMLPSKEDMEQTIKQVATMKTGGIQVKHPSAMYLGEFVSNS